ncbi:MAG: tRNA uridine-5-carboxymethylaminomethyl(34) synthesis GTPase MnmE, partial [Chromatiales bacterium]|nr:tRNA uridine-5-carboxymethylaminomethyl(34) synthesis GTPase MnmE [Chromatiales bacterium]
MGSNAPGKLGATAPITDDTIVAIASPPGQGGVGIIRISGSNVPLVASALLGGLPPPRHATLRDFKSIQGEILDRGLALFFPTPNSYTGDDLLELHGHGSPVVLDLLVREICTLDVRLARAGEFTERAFLNEKLDLAQAEAVADLISAGSAAAARGAMRSLQGVFSDRIHTVVAGIVSLRTFIEATIDFPDEDVEFLAAGDVSGKLDSLLLDLSHLRDQTAQGVVLKEGVRVALAGQPNVGKSSVLNALAQEDIALVTNI